jgi:hypothetical protein
MVGELSGWFQISDKNVGFGVNLGEAANQKGTPCNGKTNKHQPPKKHKMNNAFPGWYN